MLNFNELWPLLERSITALPTQTVPVAAALGRILAQPALAVWDLPRFDNSAMDGFAVRYADVASATQATPVHLRVIATAFAGQPSHLHLQPGQAIQIGTGGLLPTGADTVVAREDVIVLDNSSIKVATTVKPAQHVRRQGEEVNQGAVLLAAGSRLNVYALAALEAAGVQTVEVYCQPSITILVSGDELVSPGQTPQAGQIIETNGAMLTRSLEQLLNLPIQQNRLVADDFLTTKQALSEALNTADVVITTGGVSVGERDYIKDAAKALGAKQLCWGVAIKPGKPLYLAQLGRKWLVGLPGNPAAVGVALPIVILPLLSGLMGHFKLPRLLPVKAQSLLKPAGKRTHLIWARLEQRGNELLAQPLAKLGSHMLSDLALADILIVVPPSDQPLPIGSTYQAILLPT